MTNNKIHAQYSKGRKKIGLFKVLSRIIILFFCTKFSLLEGSDKMQQKSYKMCLRQVATRACKMNSPQYKPPSPKLCRLSVVECQSFLNIFVLMSGVELERDESFGGRGDDQTRTYKNKFRSLHKPERLNTKRETYHNPRDLIFTKCMHIRGLRALYR